MTKKKPLIIVSVAVAIALLIAVVAILIINNETGDKYIYIEGTVTSYDESPAAYDSLVVFSINNVKVDVGGGLRPSSIYGEFDQSITVGDKVKAKLLQPKEGTSLTIYKCGECYIKKV